MENVRAILARNIKAARKRLSLSQEELADRAEIDRTYVSGIERQVRNPTITIVAKFAQALETTTAGSSDRPIPITRLEADIRQPAKCSDTRAKAAVQKPAQRAEWTSRLNRSTR
ncbi:helix-turn-helix domain-containing protein [Pararhizobium sp. LjRoot235]|uniref:helix-turn-helix domain-containing protein n=1 Tax=Pararhizobium sp. LjRoot235 TaxID=3342291 RepID=UPI003F507F93